MSQFQEPPVVTFNPSLPAHQKPRIRPLRAGMMQQGQEQFLVLGDQQRISDRQMGVAPAVQMVLPLMDGTRSIPEICAAVGHGLTPPVLQELVAQLDAAGFLYGPTFDAMLAAVQKDFDKTAILPPSYTADVADMLVAQVAGSEEAFNALSAEQKAEMGVKRIGEEFEIWMDESLKEAPSKRVDSLPKGLIVPHVDYARGWMNYGSGWGKLRGLTNERPDRVIILGTNHFGFGTGVVGCDKGYETPLGVCEVDKHFEQVLSAKLGDADTKKLFANRYDHEREHSIELQIPWIQHVFGKDASGKYPRVFGVLVHDPCVNNGESYDNQGLGLDAFCNAVRAAVAELPGRTLIVASADLSHVGPQFGDNVPMDQNDEGFKQLCQRTAQHDQEMIRLLGQNKPEDLIAAMSWQQNPTRWCSIGCLVALYKILQPSKIEFFNYAFAASGQEAALVSSCSGATW